MDKNRIEEKESNMYLDWSKNDRFSHPETPWVKERVNDAIKFLIRRIAILECEIEDLKAKS
jgi:hypothetical protein